MRHTNFTLGQLGSDGVYSNIPAFPPQPQKTAIHALVINPRNVPRIRFAVSFGSRGETNLPLELSYLPGDVIHVPIDYLGEAIYLLPLTNPSERFGPLDTESTAPRSLDGVVVTVLTYQVGEAAPSPLRPQFENGDIVRMLRPTAGATTTIAAGSTETIWSNAPGGNFAASQVGMLIGHQLHCVLYIGNGERQLNTATDDFPSELCLDVPRSNASGGGVTERCLVLFPGGGGARRVAFNLPPFVSDDNPVRIFARNPTGSQHTKTFSWRGWIGYGYLEYEELSDNSQVHLTRSVAAGIQNGRQCGLTVSNPRAVVGRLSAFNGDSADTLTVTARPYIPVAAGGPANINLGNLIAALAAAGTSDVALNFSSPHYQIMALWGSGTPDNPSTFSIGVGAG